MSCLIDLAKQRAAMVACNIDFTNNGAALQALPASLTALNATYTRNSEKRVVQDGTLVTLAANQFGTSYDSVTGLYGYVPEPAATNLCQWSRNFSASGWSTNATIVSTNNASPSGSLDATRVTFSAGKYLRYIISGTITAGANYAVAFFVRKPAGSTAANVRVTTNNTAAWSTGVGSVTALSEKWSLAYVAGAVSTGTSIYAHVGCVKPDGTDDSTCFGDIEVWQCQIETGLRPTSPIYTAGSTATRAADVLSVPLWVNNLTYSQEFDNAVWSKSGCTITANNAGTYDKIVESSGGTFHSVSRTANLGVGIPQTVSFSASAAGRTWVWCQIGTSAAYFDIANGALGTVAGTLTASISPDPDGGYRCTVTHQNPTTTTLVIGTASGNGGASYSGDGSSGINVGKAQLEFGSTATTYRPTTSTLESTANANIPVFTAAGYTLFADGRFDTTYDATRRTVTVHDRTANNRATIGASAGSTAFSGVVISDGSVHADSQSTYSTSRFRHSMSCSVNNLRRAVNGATGPSTLTANMPISPTTLSIGTSHTGADQFNSYLYLVGLIPQALTQAQINGLTTL